MTKIDFGYTYSPPHFITLSRPSSSQKFVVEVSNEYIDINYTYQQLKDKPPLTWKVCPFDVKLRLEIFNNGKHLILSEWSRHESGAPYFFAKTKNQDLNICVSGIATKIGTIIKFECKNNSNSNKQLSFITSNMKGWVISNQGWIDGKNTNLLLSLNDGRADKIIAYGKDADGYPIITNTNNCDTGVPMASSLNNKINPMRSMESLFYLRSEETKYSYIIIPFNLYKQDVDILLKCNCEKYIKEALNEWKNTLNRNTKINFSNKSIMTFYNSCLADIFVMREKCYKKYYGISCGSTVYRSVNSFESVLAEILIDRLGYQKEFLEGIQMHIDCQDDNGCWAYSKGWEHECWGVAFNKSKAIMDHYYLTKDKTFLKKYYINMRKSTIFNYKSRQETKKDKNSAFQGLMPFGMGDCGLMNGLNYYGVYYPSNCQSVAADFYTLEAAKILNKNEDIELLEKICQESKKDLIKSIRMNAIQENGYKWIPATSSASNSSIYGCLFAFYPTNLLKYTDPLIKGTFSYIEEKSISEGGLPKGTGWLKDGLWVAMALDNIASAYLREGEYDKASAFLFPVFNHASYFMTYCEERGSEKNSLQKTGDMQHLWTPLSICSYIIDALIFETESTINICAGLPREMLDEGEYIKIKGLRTSCGFLNYSIVNKQNIIFYQVEFEREINKKILLHIRNSKYNDQIYLCFKDKKASGIYNGK